MNVSMIDTAIVFAAGLGKRLRPLTEHTPKPLIPVGGRTMLDRALDVLAEGGVKKAVVNAAYLGEQILEHVALRPGLPHLIPSPESAPLETGGAVRHAWAHLYQGPFFAMNSDIVLLPGGEQPVARLREAWHDSLDALLLVIPRERATGYDGAGDFFVSEQGVPRFREASEPTAPYVFTGLQLLHPRLFTDLPEGPFSLNLLYRRLCEAEGNHRIRAQIHDGDWLHVGDPAGLALAEDYFRRHTPTSPSA